MELQGGSPPFASHAASIQAGLNAPGNANFEFGAQGLAAGKCIMTYYAAINELDLWNDAATVESGGAPGSAAALSNSQCSIDLAHTSVQASGNAQVFTLAITFSAGFEATQEMYGLGVNSEGEYSAWVDLGLYGYGAAALRFHLALVGRAGDALAYRLAGNAGAQVPGGRERLHRRHTFLQRRRQ